VVAGSTVTCPHCAGLGIIRSTESAALRLLRALDEEGQHAPAANLTVKAPEDVAIYTLNHKRREIARIEEAYDLGISFEPQAAMAGGNFEIERTGARIPSARPRTAVSVEAGFATAAEPEQVQPPEPDITVVEAPMEATHEEEHAAPADGTGDGDGSRRRRRRRRRGGRGRDGRDGQQPHHETHAHGGHSQHPPMQETERHAEGASGAQDFESEEAQEPSTTSGTEDAAASAPGQQNQPGEGGKRRRRRRGRRGRHRGEMGGNGSGAPELVTQHEHVSAENSGDSEDRFAPPPVRIDDAAIPVVVPNAESSPQWSLADRTMEEAPATVEPVTKPRHAEVSEPAMGEVTQFRKPEPDVRQVHTEAVAEPPREARKGWWQRRFKLGGSDD
jgi:ribonuclease E